MVRRLIFSLPAPLGATVILQTSPGTRCTVKNAGLIPEDELNEENILPKAFDPRVAPAVADAVAQAARESGVARV